MKSFGSSCLILISLIPSTLFAADKVDVSSSEMAAVLTNPEVLQKVRKSMGKAATGVEGIVQGKNGYYWVKSSHCKLRVQVGSHIDPSSGKVVVDSVRPDAAEMCE